MFEKIKRYFEGRKDSIKENVVQEITAEEKSVENTSVEQNSKIQEQQADEIDCEALTAFRNMMDEALANAMLKMPMWARLGYFANTLSKYDGNEKTINWDKINTYLMLGIDKSKPYYNIYGKIKNIKQLNKAAGESRIAFLPESDFPFYRRKCRECGKPFTLTLGEIRSFEKKELKIPHRCYNCRKGIKPVSETQQTAREETHKEEFMTAMQVALQKAGVI